MVSARTGVAVLQDARSHVPLPMVVRYDGDCSSLPPKRLGRLLERIESRRRYMGSLSHAHRLPNGLNEPAQAWRQALAAVKLPLGANMAYLIALGEPGQSFHPADILRLDKIADCLGPALRHERQTLVSERRRIERLLHDRFAGTLTQLLFGPGRLARGNLNFAERRLVVRGHADARSALADLRNVLDQVTSGPTRSSTSDCLTDLLQNLVDDGVDVSTDVDDDLASSLSTDALACVYEVAREAIVNVRRHACASRVDLTLKRENRIVTLTVVDDGRGLSRAAQRSLWGGHGLRLMRERVAELGGELLIKCAAGVGTQLVASLPATD